MTRLFLQEYKIPGFLITTALRMPKLTLTVALAMLAAVAGTLTYTGFLVIGVLADYLGTGRFATGLLVTILFARVPWISKGKPAIVGLLPAPVRRPLMVSILALCALTFLARGDLVPAAFTGFTMAFLLTFPWLRKALFDRIVSSVFTFAGKKRPTNSDGMIIDGEFKEKKNDGLIDQ